MNLWNKIRQFERLRVLDMTISGKFKKKFNFLINQQNYKALLIIILNDSLLI